MKRIRMGCVLLLSTTAFACSGGGSGDRADQDPRHPAPAPAVAPQGLHRVVPTDDRAAVHGTVRARPIVGGTLLVTRDGALAIVADPERDNVSIVDLVSQTLAGQIALAAGAQPFRSVEDSAGHIHVVLRGSGEVATIDVATRSVVDQRRVCAAPRGIAFDAKNNALTVACAGGELVSLPAGDGAAVVVSPGLAADLRDVIASDHGTFVTRFKGAGLLKLDPAGAVQTVEVPVSARTTFGDKTGALKFGNLVSEMAWRTVALPDGGMLMLHQGAADSEIDIGGSSDRPDEPPPVSSYGGGGITDTCQGVVQTELTGFDAAGKQTTRARLDAVLAVDVAVSPVAEWIAVAQAGAGDPEQPATVLADESERFVEKLGRTRGGVLLLSRNELSTRGDAASTQSASRDVPCMGLTASLNVPDQIVAVAFMPDGQLLAQAREPAALLITTVVGVNEGPFMQPGFGDPARILLGNGSVRDTGHDMFHHDAGAGIACASCHGEGAEDGHTWVFSGQGPRRTQALHVGLAGTAPFHWDGELAGVADLMEDVFVARMGGVHETDERVTALQDFLFSLEPPAQALAENDAAAVRGRAMFEGEAQCAHCHSGPSLTNNQNVDVGTGAPLQVPSLVGIAYRAPYMHDGCASTLQERFAPACGGNKHGNTALLTPAQVEDLVAYLKTL